MEAHYTVYKLTDPEGKVYIGCTGKTVEKRWGKGWNYNHKSRIYKAIREFGWVNFEKKILCEKLTREGAEKLEKWFIAYYDSANPDKGYNRALGGLGKGSRMSEATKKLASDAIIGKYENDPDYRERIRKGVRTAYETDPDYRERVRKGIIKAYETNPDYRRKLSFFQKKYYAEHPERREEISRQKKEYLTRPGNRAFIDSDSHAKPVICVETGEVFRSQRAAVKATGFSGINKACSGRLNTTGGYHWRYTEQCELDPYSCSLLTTSVLYRLPSKDFNIS